MLWPLSSLSYLLPIICSVCNIESVIYIRELLLFSHSVGSDSLRLQGLQHTRLPCPSLSPETCLHSCPLSLWCHPSSAILFSPHLRSFPASASFLTSWLFSSGGQSIGASASASVLPMNIQGWFPLMNTNNLTNLENDKD